MSTPTIATDLCPACGQSNRCTLSDPGPLDQPCWCFTQTIDPAVIAALPDELRNKACLCPRCAGVLETHATGATDPNSRDVSEIPERPNLFANKR